MAVGGRTLAFDPYIVNERTDPLRIHSSVAVGSKTHASIPTLFIGYLSLSPSLYVIFSAPFSCLQFYISVIIFCHWLNGSFCIRSVNGNRRHHSSIRLLSVIDRTTPLSIRLLMVVGDMSYPFFVIEYLSFVLAPSASLSPTLLMERIERIDRTDPIRIFLAVAVRGKMHVSVPSLSLHMCHFPSLCICIHLCVFPFLLPSLLCNFSSLSLFPCDWSNSLRVRSVNSSQRHDFSLCPLHYHR